MKRVLNLLASNQTTLFLGAGLSMGIGGPSGNALISEVKRQFNDVEWSGSRNFFDICKDVLDSENHSRVELEEFILKRLEGLYPNNNHNELVSLPWKCIFTTNYDTVLEKIPSANFGNRTLRPIKQRNPNIELNRRDILYYIKIFGSIDSRYGEEGYPILSRTDYNTSFLSRNSYYQILSDCIRQGPIVFLGYSFEDNLVFDLMAELQQVSGPDIVRTSYAISPDNPADKVLKKFAKYNIIHIKGTFEDLINISRDKFKDQKLRPLYSDKTIHVKGYPLEIPISLERACSEYFTFLNSLSGKSSIIKDINNFFSGAEISFYPYSKNWDFIREIYSLDGSLDHFKCAEYGHKVKNGLKNHLFRLIGDTQPENNEITILTGAAGCGKTIILNRLAFDWYTSGSPVILMDPQSPNIDFRQVDSFIDFIDENLKKRNEEHSVGVSKTRILIICDNSRSFYDEYRKLFDYLTSRSRLISMVIADRENMLPLFEKSHYDVYSIPETISPEECERFKKHLLSIGLIETEAELYSLIDDPTINNSFFALMYTIIDESRRPLNEIIHDQYMSLKDWPKKVYEYVCLFNYYGINPNEELLVRSVLDSYGLFISEVEEGSLNKVIFRENTELEKVEYRVHHPIIASRTVSIELNDPSIRVQKFLEVLNKFNPFFPHETKIIKKFLICEIGPNSKDKEIPINLKKELFKLVSSKIESRSIYHHYALLELEGEPKNFDNALLLLNKAYGVKTSEERDELLFTSFGKLYSQKGYYLESEGEIEQAIQAYNLAEKYFKMGRNLSFKNSYSYHGQIILCRRRAEKSTEDTEKVKLLSEAMELCDEAVSNLGLSNHEMFFEQEMYIMHSLNDLESFDSIVTKLAEEYNSPLGYRLKANILYKESFKKDIEEMFQTLEEAYTFVNRGLVIDSNNSGLLRLNAKIGLQLYPADKDKVYEVLKRWYDFSDKSDLNLLLHYSVNMFEKGYYEDSKKTLRELDFQSHGIPNRSSIQKSQFLTDINNNRKRFNGIITHLESGGRRGYLKCVSLPNLLYEILFFPHKFTPEISDYVSFEMGFNMRGVFAFDVRKD